MAPLFSVASRPIGGGAGAGTGTGGGSATTTTTTTYGGNRLKQVQAREQQPSSSSSLSSGSSPEYYDSERVSIRPAAPAGAGAVRKGLPMLGGARKSLAAPTSAAARPQSSASASSASSSRLALPVYSRRPGTEDEEDESDDEEEEADAVQTTVRIPPPSASTLHAASSSSGSRLPALSRPEHRSPGKKLGTSSSASGRIVVSASPARPSASSSKSSSTSSANTGTGRTHPNPLSTSSLRPPHLSTTLPPAQASGRRTFGEKDPNVLGSSSSPSLSSQANSSSSYSSGRISLAPSGGTAELQKPGGGVSSDAPQKPPSGTTLLSHRRQESIGKENRDPSLYTSTTTTTTVSGSSQGSAPRPAYSRESSYGTSTTRPSLSNASTSIPSSASSTSTITPSSTLIRPPLLSRSSGSNHSSSSSSSALSALPSSSSSSATAAATSGAAGGTVGGGGPKRQLLGSRAAYRSSSGHSSVAIKLGLAPVTSSAALPSATPAQAPAAAPAGNAVPSSTSSSITPGAVHSNVSTAASATNASASAISASRLDSASSTSTSTAEPARTSFSFLGTASGRTGSSAQGQMQSKAASATGATSSSLSSSTSSSTSGSSSISGSGRVSLTTAGGSRDSIQSACGSERRPSQHQQQSTGRKEHSRLSVLRETAHEASPSALSPLRHRAVRAQPPAAKPGADVGAEAECWTPTRDRTRRPRPQRRTAAASGAINYCEDSPTLDERIYARAHVGEKKRAAAIAPKQPVLGLEKSQQRPREERGADHLQLRTAQSQSTFAHTPPRPDRPRPSARPSSVREIDFDLLDRERERTHQHSVGAVKEKEEEDESQESIILLSHTVRRSSVAPPTAKASAPAPSVARARTEAAKAESAKAPPRKKTAEELEEDELAELVEEQLHALTIGKGEKAASVARPTTAPALRPVQPTATNPAPTSKRPVSRVVAAPKPKDPLAALLAACGQSKTLDFEACLSALLNRPGSRRSIIKIGEASYSEVYRIQPAPTSASSMSAAPDEPSIVLKVIPLRPKSPVIDAETGEEQNSLGENLPATSSCTNALRELRVTRSLGGSPEALQLILPGQHAPFSAPSSASSSSMEPEQGLPGFVRLYGAFVARGLYASALMRCWDEFDAAVKDGSENRSPERFEEQQQYMVLALSDGGADLEHVKLTSWVEAAGVFWQLVQSLAAAEQARQFEHRDLHWGNVLVSKTTKSSSCSNFAQIRDFAMRGSTGIQAVIIDFTLSRTALDDGTVVYDPMAEEELFTGRGDLQFDIYRHMASITARRWREFHPATNLSWLRYLVLKLMDEKRIKPPPSSRSASTDPTARQAYTSLKKARELLQPLSTGMASEQEELQSASTFWKAASCLSL